MTKAVQTRLNKDELSHLDQMAFESQTACESRSEFIRLLLHREWNRRKGLPKPKPRDFQGIYRFGGRPKTISQRLPEAEGVSRIENARNIAKHAENAARHEISEYASTAFSDVQNTVE